MNKPRRGAWGTPRSMRELATESASGQRSERGADKPRRGASLTEVLVALVILTIGLTSVISLFPVGVNRVRNATLDTRTTIVAANANALFHLKRMANDPMLVDLAAYDLLKAQNTEGAEFIFDDLVRNPLAFTAWSPTGWPSGVLPTDHALYSFPSAPLTRTTLLGRLIPSINVPYLSINRDVSAGANIWEPNFRERLLAEEDDVFGQFAGGIARTDVQDASNDYNMSYPVLLDPYLYDAMAFQFGLLNPAFYAGTSPAFGGGVPRINIATALTRYDGTAVPGFENYYGSPSFTGPVRPFADIAVLSLSEITLLPPAQVIGSLTPAQVSIDRETVKAHWFASSADIQYSADVPGQPRNPAAQDYLDTTGTLAPLETRNYFEPVPINTANPPSLSNPIRATAQRDYDYTWAAMIQRRLTHQKEGSPDEPTVAMPNLSDREFKGKLAIMCFYRRNLQQPYRVIEGCFYTGSKLVTLSWPSNLPAPTINFGTWLCEASISRSTLPASLTGVTPDPMLGSTATLSGTYVDDDPLKVVDYTPVTLSAATIKGRRMYRRTFSFHRVVAVGETFDDVNTGRTYVQVTIERPAIGFPLRYQNPNTRAIGDQSGQDDRPIDPYVIPQWPIIDRRDTASIPTILQPGVADETNCSLALTLAGQPVPASGTVLPSVSSYYPVILFDGLRDVFEYNVE